MTSGAAPRGITLILLAWNGWDVTRRALDSLLASELGDAGVLVVDNGSTDHTAQGLREYAGRIRVLRLAANTGYVRGNNAGIRVVDPAHDIVLLNNDLEFPQRDWLARLRASAYSALPPHPVGADDRREPPRAGLVGCRLLDGDGNLLHAGTLILPDDCRGVQVASGRVERDIGQYAGHDRIVQGVAFAVVYIRREVIDAIGSLHTDYDTYFEDSDYCLRARAAGFASVLCASANVVHRQHASTAADVARRERLYAQGQVTFRRHWQQRLRDDYRVRVRWQSALEFPPRYAQWSQPLLRALDRAGVELRYESLYRDLPPPLAESGDSHDHVLNTIRARGSPTPAPITIACGEATLFRHAQGRTRIGYGDFATREELDAPTVAAWNALDEAWVPSAWHARMLRDAGATVPIAVVPPGVDADYFHPGLVRHANPCGEFVFLLAAAWDEGEQPWRVMQAFARAFRRDERVRLVAWISGSGMDLPAAIRALEFDPHGGRISFLPDHGIPEYQRGLVYRAADAFVMAPGAARGELRLLQAMAAGLPVIAPAHPAFDGLVCDAHGWPLPFTDADANDAVAGIVDDAAIDEALIHSLRRAAAAPAQARQLGLQASVHVTRERTWAHTAARIAARLDALAAQEPAQARPARIAAAPPRPAGRVLVLGMHRSGTSCVAGALQMMGLYGADAHEFLANEADNPFGFFERADLHAACVAALAQRGGDWSIPLGWSDGEAAAARANFRSTVHPILGRLESRGGWFVKEPRLCLLADELAGLIDSPVFVRVYRDPRSVARSLARRDGLTLPHALALWEYYQLAALRASHGRRSVRVHYHLLQRAPAAQLARLFEELRAHGVAGLRALQAAECAAWVRPELDRSEQGDDVPLPAAIEALWHALRADEVLLEVPALSAPSERLLHQLHAEHQLVLQRQRDRV